MKKVSVTFRRRRSAGYSLAYEDLVWILRGLDGARVQAFREKEQGIRYAEGLAKTRSIEVTLSVITGSSSEVIRFRERA